MNWDAIGAIGEIIGAVAVVLSLIYLGFQIRHNSISSRAQSELTMIHRFADWHGRAAEHPELANHWDNAIEDSGRLTDEDARQLLFYIAELFLITEGCFELYRKGFISESSWQAKVVAIRAHLNSPLISKWWSSRLTPMSQEFRDYINSHEAAGAQWDVTPIASILKSN